MNLIDSDDAEDIEQFINDMRGRASKLSTYNGTDQPRDDDGNGAYLERDLFSGVTLVMDWAYLDAPSTYLVISKNAPGYNPSGTGFLDDAGALYVQLGDELRDLLDASEVEYDSHANVNDADVYHVHGVYPF